jgi:hypothetical protein
MQLPSSTLVSLQVKGGWVQLFSFVSPCNFLADIPLFSPLLGDRLYEVVAMSKHHFLKENGEWT